jgi:hypothetical protein
MICLPSFFWGSERAGSPLFPARTPQRDVPANQVWSIAIISGWEEKSL